MENKWISSGEGAFELRTAQVVDSACLYPTAMWRGSLATEVLIAYAFVRDQNSETLRGVHMAIEKKSLISKRIATKKALVAKPQVSSKPGLTRVATMKVRVAAARIHVE